MVEGKPVRHKYDWQERNKYGRLLAYAFSGDGKLSIYYPSSQCIVLRKCIRDDTVICLLTGYASSMGAMIHAVSM